jgi:streptogramin lyase
MTIIGRDGVTTKSHTDAVGNTSERLGTHEPQTPQVDLHNDCIGCTRNAAVGPHGLGVGPDGLTLWYTGKSAGTVGRVSANGTVKSFRLADPGSQPIYITAGPDGNMWFTELTGK